MFLQSFEDERHFQSYYSDIRMIGKHFRIVNYANPDCTRHYTICNAVHPEFYEKINQALKANNFQIVEKCIENL